MEHELDVCKYYYECQNNTNCYRCLNHSILKLNNPKKQFKTLKKKAKDSGKSWQNLENEVAKGLSEVVTLEEANRTLRSGALEYDKSDISDDLLFIECKERTGRQLKGGDKSLTIKKSWLTEAKEYAEIDKKEMILPFRFKNDEDIYVVIHFKELKSLISKTKAYYNRNIKLEKENEILKQHINKKENNK